MSQQQRRVFRLLEAGARRSISDQLLRIEAAEDGVIRALMQAFGERPPPLPDVDEFMEEKPPDRREEIVLKIMDANR